MRQEKYQDFTCASGLLQKRFVTVTAATDSVAYTAAAAAADGITIGDEDNLRISVLLFEGMSESFYFDVVAALTKGENVEVGADGKGTPEDEGSVVCISKTAAAAGSFGTGYNK